MATEINDIKDLLDFTRGVKVGDIVQARWKNTGNWYSGKARVVKINPRSIRVQLTESVSEYGTGAFITCPKTLMPTWCMEFGIFPVK